MAIIQISKIQQRSGKLVDLPQLDNAQFGWANDAKRLFIGAPDPENVEVLTAYSNISFSQITGSEGSNVNLTDIQPGQILSYDVITNNWINTGGNASDPGNTSYYTSTTVHLGTIENIKIGGGAIGYVLETDGSGNISWTPKGVITAFISDVTQANPGIVTTVDDNFFVNGSLITITDIDGMTELNGNSYYVDVLSGNTFALYNDLSLTLPVDTTGFTAYTGNGRAVTYIGSGSTSGAPGSNGSVLFNNSGIIDASANLVLNGANLAVTANLTAGNVFANTGRVIGSLLTGTVTTNAQPNITSVGTLVSLNVTGAISATGNIRGANLSTPGALSVTGDSTLGNINITGNIIPTANVTYDLGNATNSFRDLYLSGTSLKLGTQTLTSNSNGISISNAIFASSGTFTTLEGTLTTGTQPNITSIGTLTSISVTGNVTAGGVKTDTYLYANGSPLNFNGTYSNSNVANYLPTFTGTLGATSSTLQGSILTSGANTSNGTITGRWTLSTGSRLTATYADLAEYYEADHTYEPGTVLEFGGDKEVTLAQDETNRVAGVVSTSPAYAMNSECPGHAVAIALQGRVPVKVRGKVQKGDMMVSAGNGYARPTNQPKLGTIIGKSLVDFDGVEGVIEIAVGRL